MPVELVETLIEKTRFTSELGRGSETTGVADCAEEMGRMRPAHQQNKFWRKPRQPDVSGGDFAKSVAVDVLGGGVLGRCWGGVPGRYRQCGVLDRSCGFC